MIVQIRPQIIQLLNFNYSTNLFTSPTSFANLITIAQTALQARLERVRLGLTSNEIHTYKIQLHPSTLHPFEQSQVASLNQLVHLANQCIIAPDYQLMKQLSKYVVDQCCKTGLVDSYKGFVLEQRYMGVKEAIIMSALSQCKIWFTICKERRKSGKQFDLDPLINYFQKSAHKWQIVDPFHSDILPKKQVKSIQKKNNLKKTNNPLYEAVSEGNIPKVKEILLNGGDIESPLLIIERDRNKQITVAHQACAKGDLEMCKLLHSFRVNWEAEDIEKMTPLFYAVQISSLAIIQFLIEQCKVNIQKVQIQKRTPFYFACTQSDMKVIKYLYSKGANINHQSQLGRSALSKSCYLGRKDIVQFLLGCKQVNIMSQDKKGRTALHNAVFGPKGGRQGHKFGTNSKDSPDCAQILLQHGLNVDTVDFQNNTALHIAMSSQAIDSIRVLLAYGASLKARNNYEQTPLMTGSKFGHLDAVRIVVQEYVDDITVKDTFGKNLILLTAKFKTQTINPVYPYILQPLLQILKHSNQFHQIYDNLKTLLRSKSLYQVKLFIEICEKLSIDISQLQFADLITLIEFGFDQRDFIKKVVTNWKLQAEDSAKLIKHLVQLSDFRMIEFINQHSKHLLQIESQSCSNVLFQQLGSMKQKMISYCYMGLDLNWLDYKDQYGGNLIHSLIRFKKVGSIIQLLKFLSGVDIPFCKNKYLLKLRDQDKKECLKRLLLQTDNQGFDAYKLSMVMKDSVLSKIIQQKIKKEDIHYQSHIDVKQYALQYQDDQQQIKIFNTYQCQAQLLSVMQHIQKDPHHIINTIKLSSVHQAWSNFNNRNFYYCSNQQHLQNLKSLLKQPIIGIDLQYFLINQSHVLSTIQISSPTEDFLIDCLAIPLCNIKQPLRSIFHNQTIIKVMHGSDNDLQIIKSNLNISIVNLIDTSRIHVEIKKENDLKGLALLSSIYLNIQISKQYQVSEWRIRPLPKAMIDYARKDSMILPYLAYQMFSHIPKQSLQQTLINGCKQARKNKKANQNLIKKIICMK